MHGPMDAAEWQTIPVQAHRGLLTVGYIGGVEGVSRSHHSPRTMDNRVGKLARPDHNWV